AREPVQVVVTTVGITEARSIRVRVFPNPTTDNLSIDLSSVSGVSKVELMDLTGRAVRTVANAKQGSLLTMSVDNLAAGEYTLRVNHSGGSSMHRVVVQ
ncbi:MAG TPA: T9SS type A sorting domain-containing protein, partial [Flavobacteriales bacterium]|nr:T9SS type A sorting domain-containing protein [Flavobacteriales bacterium]